jgi:hypothetical protein
MVATGSLPATCVIISVSIACNPPAIRSLSTIPVRTPTVTAFFVLSIIISALRPVAIYVSVAPQTFLVASPVVVPTAVVKSVSFAISIATIVSVSIAVPPAI